MHGWAASGLPSAPLSRASIVLGVHSTTATDCTAGVATVCAVDHTSRAIAHSWGSWVLMGTTKP
jgi:hypothetical protein